MTGERASIRLGTVLVIEDNPGDVYLIRLALKRQGCHFEIQTMGDGEKALAYLRELSQKADRELPGLILLDLNLPRVDGGQLLQFIRRTDTLASIPVIVISSSPEDVISLAAPRAAGYLQKPGTLEEVTAVGERIVQYWQSAQS